MLFRSGEWMYWLYSAVFMAASVANFAQLVVAVIFRSYESVTFYLSYSSLLAGHALPCRFGWSGAEKIRLKLSHRNWFVPETNTRRCFGKKQRTGEVSRPS